MSIALPRMHCTAFLNACIKPHTSCLGSPVHKDYPSTLHSDHSHKVVACLWAATYFAMAGTCHWRAPLCVAVLASCRVAGLCLSQNVVWLQHSRVSWSYSPRVTTGWQQAVLTSGWCPHGQCCLQAVPLWPSGIGLECQGYSLAPSYSQILQQWSC